MVFGVEVCIVEVNPIGSPQVCQPRTVGKFNNAVMEIVRLLLREKKE
jgi:hypothetical protein